MARSVRVLIVDDNRILRKGIRLQLEQTEGITVIGEAGTGIDAVTIARAEKADIVLMDLEMPEMNGVEATRILTRSGGSRRPAVIVLTSHTADHHVLKALEAGASGYLVKTHDSANMIEAIFATARGEAVVSSRVAGRVIRELNQRTEVKRGDPSPSVLSRAEKRVVLRLSRGITGNEEIAEDLGLSVNTVRSQLKSALVKTKFADKTQLALWAVRQGLTSPDD